MDLFLIISYSMKEKNKQNKANKQTNSNNNNKKQVTRSRKESGPAFGTWGFRKWKLDQLHEALQEVSWHRRTVLHWVPSHSGIPSNEAVDKLAKWGAAEDQGDITLSHFKKWRRPSRLAVRLQRWLPLVNTKRPGDHLTPANGPQQAEPAYNMHRKLQLAPVPLCSCGEVRQWTEHTLLDCQNHQR